MDCADTEMHSTVQTVIHMVDMDKTLANQTAGWSARAAQGKGVGIN